MTLRFNFKPHQDNVLTLPHKIRVSWYHPYPKGLSAGEQWQLSVKLKPPFGMMNPGGFDYEGWLFQQGFGATGYIKKSDSNIKLADAIPMAPQRLPPNSGQQYKKSASGQ